MAVLRSLSLPLLLLGPGQADPSDRARGWIEVLRSGGPERRMEAARKLAELRWREAIPDLVPLLRDESGEVRWSALAALVDLRARSHAKEILPLLGDPEARLRALAARAAGALGFREAIPRIASLLADEAEYVRLDALRCLVQLRAKERAPDLLTLLKDARYPRGEVIRAVCDLRAPGTASNLIGLLRGGEADEGSRISWALCAMEARETAPELMDLLDHPRAGVRQVAVDALAGLGAREAASRLVALLLDESRDDSVLEEVDAPRSAAFALRTLRAGDVVHDLVRITETRDGRARRLAALALGGIGRNEGIPVLLNLLKSEDASDQLVAIGSLAELGAREAIPDLTRLLEAGGSIPAMYALPALVDLEAKEAVPALLRLAFHPEGEVRYPARRALPRVDPKAAAEEGRKLLAHEGSGARAFGADLVGSAGTVEDVPALGALLRDPYPGVRLSATRAIQGLVPEERMPAVLEDLKRRLGPLGEEALRGFAPPDAGEVVARLRAAVREGKHARDEVAAATDAGAEEAIPLIRSLLPGSGPSDRKWLGLQLCRLGSRDAVDDILDAAIEGGLDFVPLTPLNAIRSPRAWARLRTKRLGSPLAGTREEVVEAIAREAGMSVVWPEPRHSEKFRLSVLERESRRRRVPERPGRPTLIEALEEALRDGHRLEVFLEGGRILILRHDDAVERWVAWWADEVRKGRP